MEPQYRLLKIPESDSEMPYVFGGIPIGHPQELEGFRCTAIHEWSRPAAVVPRGNQKEPPRLVSVPWDHIHGDVVNDFISSTTSFLQMLHEELELLSAMRGHVVN